jgi:hypothetical protein
MSCERRSMPDFLSDFGIICKFDLSLYRIACWVHFVLYPCCYPRGNNARLEQRGDYRVERKILIFRCCLELDRSAMAKKSEKKKEREAEEEFEEKSEEESETEDEEDDLEEEEEEGSTRST